MCRTVMGGLLQNLAQYPPETVVVILQLLCAKVLDMDDAIPAKLQSEAFSDAALAQVQKKHTPGLLCVDNGKLYATA